MTLLGNPNLTQPGGAPPTKSHAGMAHFAGTGPEGKVCGECAHYWHAPDGFEGRCGMYRKLMGRKRLDVRFPKTVESCKYFEPARLK